MTEAPFFDPTRDLPRAPAKENSAAWALAIAASALPFLSELPIDVDRLAPLALLPAVWLGRNAGQSSSNRNRAESLDRWLLISAGVVATVSATLSAHPSSALVQSASLTWVLAGAFLASRLAANLSSMALILRGITFGAATGCLAVWIDWKEGTSISTFPYYGHGRLFGLHMMIGAMTALAWLSNTRPKTVERYTVLLLAIVTSGGMLWSGGRAPLIGFAAGVATWWWAVGRGHRRTLVQQIALVVTGGLVLSLLRWSPEPYLGWWGAISRSAAATSVDELSSTRISFWRVTWQEFLQSPWLGHGADAYRFIQPKQDGSQPHNWPLQLLADFGILGGIPLGALALRQAWRGLVDHSSQRLDIRLSRIPVAGAFSACLAAGLLDGVFYHAVLLVPAALLGGMAGSRASAYIPIPADQPSRGLRIAAPLVLMAATAVLALHIGVGILLSHFSPRNPDALSARLVRIFPSTTFGLVRWLNVWRGPQPDDAVTWARWAQRHSDNPAELHVYVAVICANRGDFSAAAVEVDSALRKCHVRARPPLIELQRAIAEANAAARSR